MKKILITGGAGFIGSHTCVELVQAGLQPIIVDDLRNSHERILLGLEQILGERPVIYRIDCADGKALSEVIAKERPDGVIHFAADKAVGESVADPLKYYANNIGSLATVLRAMAAAEVKNIVFSSSCTVYGKAVALPVSETSPDTDAASPYGFTKVVCERMLRDASAADPRLKAVLLRYFNPIGAHPSSVIGELPLGVPNNLIPFITQTAAGIRDRLTVFGVDHGTPDGSCIRDFIHVSDLADAHVRALRWMESRSAPLCEVFNLGTGRGNSVLEVLRVFEAVNGVKVRHVIGPRRSGDVPAMYADIGKSRDVLGWTAKRDLADSLRDAWQWQLALGRSSDQ